MNEINERDQRVRPWKELRSTGLLWLINAALLHPRGFAIAVVLDDKDELVGWQLLGDGSEPWRFGDDIDEPFRLVEEFLSAHRTDLGGAAAVATADTTESADG